MLVYMACPTRSHLLHHRSALWTEAADGAGITLALAPAEGLGQSCDPGEQGRSLGLQLERQVVQDAHAVFHRLSQQEQK